MNRLLQAFGQVANQLIHSLHIINVLSTHVGPKLPVLFRLSSIVGTQTVDQFLHPVVCEQGVV